MPSSDTKLRANPRITTVSSDGTRSESRRARSGADGAYSVVGLPLDEEYVAVAEAEGFARSEEVTGLRLHLDRLEATATLALRPTGGLVVRLLDLDGRPVLDPAQVRVGDMLGGHRQTERGSDGAYRFPGLDPGETTVHVETALHLPASAPVRVESGKDLDVVVRLDPGARVEGIVVDEEGRPVAEARVSVGRRSANEKLPSFDDHVWYLMDDREATTDAGGRFVVGGLLPGEVVAGAEKHARLAGGTLRPREVVRLRAPAKDVRLVVVRLPSASLRLLTPEGKPYSGRAYVLFARHGQGRGGGSETVLDGVVRLDGLPVGAVDVDVQIGGFAPVERTFETRLRDHKDLGEVRLDPGLEARGRVLDLAGEPVPGARVSRKGAHDGVAADARGEFLLSHLPRTRVRIEVEADGFLAGSREVDPGAVAVEIRLSRGASVRGTVRGADGKRVEDAALLAARLRENGMAAADGEGREWERSDAAGRVEWRLAAGRWRIAWGVGSGEEVPLGEFTFAEGETRDLDLRLPPR
jgi:hypothetical protein